MDQFKKDKYKYISNIVDKTLNFANSERSWTKEQIANIVVFLNNHYRVQYNFCNDVSIYNLDGNFVETFKTYEEFIDWYENLIK